MHGRQRSLYLLSFFHRSQDRFDMVAFWKDVATKVIHSLRMMFLAYCFYSQAPHHSRASWMKFWRRHKHELNRTEGDDPLPQPPEKKMRYSRSDDILLAKYFFTKPEGTSDRMFQTFGRLVCIACIPDDGQSVSGIIVASSSSLERMAGTSPDTQSKN